MRESLEALQLPGYKVMRWERDWHAEGQPFHDPATYAATSLATTGTHDTDMLADWWDTTTDEERAALLALPGLRDGGFSPDQPYDDTLRDAMIRLLLQSGSDLVIFPLQDIFGWRDRINVPATVGPDNWSWASRIPIDQLLDDPVGPRARRDAAEDGRGERRGRDRSPSGPSQRRSYRRTPRRGVPTNPHGRRTRTRKGA